VPTVTIPRRLTSLAGALLLTAALVPTAAQPVAAAGGSDLVNVANAYRASQGLGPVAVHSVIDQIAVERGRQLVKDGKLGHDFEYLKARFSQLGICWRGFGEIVAYNSTGAAHRFGDQWWNSSPHRSVMLGDYTHAGGSIEPDGKGRYFGVMVFVRLCGAPTPQPVSGSGFTDTAGSPFVADIAWLVDQGITNGCGDNRFCPRSPVTREQMASFLKRAMGLPATSTDYFDDDWFSQHEDDINRIARASLTNGCDSDRYCPLHEMTREQMATFLARALGLPSTGGDYFWDDEGSIHEDAINRLAAAGITNGCGGGRYCARGEVTREQMAAFLHRAFD
jgi:uncharacterized protein YkwD